MVSKLVEMVVIRSQSVHTASENYYTKHTSWVTYAVRVNLCLWNLLLLARHWFTFKLERQGRNQSLLPKKMFKHSSGASVSKFVSPGITQQGNRLTIGGLNYYAMHCWRAQSIIRKHYLSFRLVGSFKLRVVELGHSQCRLVCDSGGSP